MTAPSYGDLDIKEHVRRSTAASGVPYYVEDPATLDRIARMFATAIKTTKTPRSNEGLPKDTEA